MVSKTNQGKEGSQVLYQMLKKTIKFKKTILLVLNCRKRSLEIRKPDKSFIIDSQWKVNFHSLIVIVSKSSTKTMIIRIMFKNYKINLAFLLNAWHSSYQLLHKVLLFSIKCMEESLSYFLFLTSWIPTK